MYRTNDLKKNVLIVPDEVIFHGSTKHTLDQRMILPHIIVAEERFVRPALGYTFYQYLITAKNTLVTAGNKATLETATGVTLEEGDVVNALEFLSTDYKALWTEILWKFTAECVMMVAEAKGFVQFGSEGPIHTAPPAGPMTTSGNVTPDLRSMKWSIDNNLMSRIDPLAESLHLFLCKNLVKYTMYKKPCDCDVNGVAYKRKTQFLTGLYDEDEDCGCP